MIGPDTIRGILTRAAATFADSGVSVSWTFTDDYGVARQAVVDAVMGPVSLRTISLMAGDRSEPSATLVMAQADIDDQAAGRGLRNNDRVTVTKSDGSSATYTVVYIPPSAGGVFNVLIGPQYG
jgi:hypothetical protein